MSDQNTAIAMVVAGTVGIAALLTFSVSVLSPNDGINMMGNANNNDTCCTDKKCCTDCKPRPKHRPSLLTANYGHMYITSTPRSSPDSSPNDKAQEDNTGSVTKIEVLNSGGENEGNTTASIPKALSLMRQPSTKDDCEDKPDEK